MKTSGSIQSAFRIAGAWALFLFAAAAQGGPDTDGDGLADAVDSCPSVSFEPNFDSLACGTMDGDPGNDPRPECKSRERVRAYFENSSVFATHIAFSVVRRGEIQVADAFSYLGQGVYEQDPEGVHRLFRIGSTSKCFTAVASKALEEAGVLSLGDLVDDDDASEGAAADRTLGNLLSHRGAFSTDYGSVHLFCYDGDLSAFWADPDDAVSPHYDSEVWGNFGGGYNYSAFNYSLAGAYLANRTGQAYAEVIQSRLFDQMGMCTATLDGDRAKDTAIGGHYGVSQSAAMHIGPYINMVSATDERCVDNYYSSDALPGDSYQWLAFQLDEAAAVARDPAGGVIASVIDMAWFAQNLLASYHGTGGLLSSAGVRELWSATTDLGCGSGCPYERYYGLGFFTDAQPGEDVFQCGHGGSRAGFTSAFVLRPQADLAVSILVNANMSTVDLSNLAKAILDDFEAFKCDAEFAPPEGLLDFFDVLAFLSAFGGQQPIADLNDDGVFDFFDIQVFLTAYAVGCP
jgi:CubicO group peptidase (beta-lactamase class C family)